MQNYKPVSTKLTFKKRKVNHAKNQLIKAKKKAG